MRLTRYLYQSIERMWWRQQKPPLLWRGFSSIYQFASNYEQKKRLQQAIKPPLPLISIGNISVGGSGKTPFTIWLAQQLKKQAFRPVILCRGDGGNLNKPQLLDHQSLASHVGDEAVLLHRMSQCPVIAGRDRLEASRMAAQHGNIILLDDGFQYRQLQRQCDIVLIPNEAFGNGYLLPAGPLRELPSALNRANIIVRTCPTATAINKQQKEWHWQTQAKPLCDWTQQQQTPPDSVIAVSAIARPQRFTASLQSLGIHVQQSYFFPDHHPFCSHDLQPIWQQQQHIAVTAKDAVKLMPIWPKNRSLWVLEQDSAGENGLVEAIINTLDTSRSQSQC